MFRKSYMTLVAAVTLLLLTVAPVYAAPSLSLGSRSSYDLTGKIQVDQSCTTDNLAYAAQACNGFSSVTFPTYVSIFDHNNCSTKGDPLCSFNPTTVYVTQGDMVVWQNFGNVTHSAIANMTLNVGLPSFDSGPIAPHGGSFSYSFAQVGSYHYYDSSYKWMTGIVYVNPAAVPPQAPTGTSNHVDLSGTIGWNVEGLSSDQVNLNVSHQISVSVYLITPVTESGNFEQSINLSTRVESPSTAASVVKSLLSSLLPALSGGSLLTGGPGPIFQTMLSGQFTSPDHTQWWVNGPLSIGSPVQILHGWSSVTGSESLNLGTTIGTRSAWIVTSELSQSLSVTMPNQNNPLSQPSTALLTASLKFLWSYDKIVDLLLRNRDTLSLTTHSVTPTTIYTSCGPYSCTPVPVTVTRDMALTIILALHLASTTVQLLGSPSPASSLMSLLSALPWVPLGIGGLAAAVAVALIVWFTRRTKGTTMPQPPPATIPSAPPATPA